MSTRILDVVRFEMVPDFESKEEVPMDGNGELDAVEQPVRLEFDSQVDMAPEAFGLGPDAFDRQLALLDARLEDVPFGWQRLYTDMRSALRAVRCERRCKTALFGPAFHAEGGLEVYTVNADRVVDGIVRKAHLRSLSTCQQCGRRGKLRRVGYYKRCLCARCGALQMLEVELRNLVGEIERDPEAEPARTWDLAQISPRVRALIDRASWRVSARDGDQQGGLCVTDDDMVRSLPVFRRVWERVCAEIERRD